MASQPATATPPRGESSRATLDVEGMHCASCVSTIERALGSTPGVSEATVNLATEQAAVGYDPDHASVAELVAAMERVGYAARERGENAGPGQREAEREDRARAELRGLRLRSALAAATGTVLLFLTFVCP